MAIVLAGVMMMPQPSARADRPAVISPSELPGGRSYEQWTVEWWKWAWSVPAFANPIGPWVGITPQSSYPRGYDCGTGQDRNSPVFFLAGTPGNAAERDCTIPARKMIFFPVINIGNEYPCPDHSFRPGPGQSLEQFLTIGYRPNFGARQFMDAPPPLKATLDGLALVPDDLAKPPTTNPYRATSPMFRIRIDPTLATVNWDPCIMPGTEQSAVSDGYWIMLNPLTPGRHTLSFSGGTLSVIFNLTVDSH